MPGLWLRRFPRVSRRMLLDQGRLQAEGRPVLAVRRQEAEKEDAGDRVEEETGAEARQEVIGVEGEKRGLSSRVNPVYHPGMAHELGCCGYDELEYKPPTTKPIGRAAVVKFSHNPSYKVKNVRMSGDGIWVCPECSRLNWTVEDFGPGQHLGITKNIGQAVAPRCARHPDVAMVLSA